MPEHATEISAARPETLDHVIGNRQVVEQLRVALAAHWNDVAAGASPGFGPVLLAGTMGCGKTMLAQILAAELGARLKETLGPSLGVIDLYEVLMESTDDTVLMIDEGHTMHELAQHILLPAVEDRVLLLSLGTPPPKSNVIRLSRFVTVVATTNPEGLIAPLRNRMKLNLQVEPYSVADLALLCKQRAQALRWDAEEPVYHLVARCGKATPRLTLRLFEACRRTCRADNENVITVAHFHRTVDLEGLEPSLGLDKGEQAYLRALAAAEGRPLRLHLLAAQLGVRAKTLADVTESYLSGRGSSPAAMPAGS